MLSTQPWTAVSPADRSAQARSSSVVSVSSMAMVWTRVFVVRRTARAGSSPAASQ
jgi:hypothetical protein